MLKKYLVLVLVSFFVPSMVFASNIYFETSKNSVSAGDTFVVSVKVDSGDIKVNSIEGDIVLDAKNNNFVVNDFSLSKSIFTLWPRTPSLSKDGSVVSFVGGVPGGFKDEGVTLFNIVIETNKEGEIVVSPKNMAVYANDGKGSRVPVKAQNLTIKVSPKNEANAPINEWINIVTNDKTSPKKFDIVIGKEDSLFEGKRFAFFNAQDDQSGISYYEVLEGDNPVVRSGSMYVLQNQNEDYTPKIQVTAYDKAGNKTVSVYKKPVTKVLGFSLNFVIIMAVIIIAWLFKKKIKRNRSNVQN